MVNATIDNTPVSIQLRGDESTTVPSNETWKVTLSLSCRDLTGPRQRARISINGVTALTIVGDMSQGPVTSPSDNFVLAGGDTILANENGGDKLDATIQGFVVNS